MDIGHLEAVIRDDKITGYVGEINLVGVAGGEVCLKPRHGTPQSEHSPSHDVLYRPAGSDRWGAFGVAWTKEMKSGEPYWSIQLQSPVLQSVVNIAAFPDDDDKGKADAGAPTQVSLVYSPPRAGSRAAISGVGTADALEGDGIPV